MKKIKVMVILCVTIFYSTIMQALLKDRTIAHHKRQDIQYLLNEIGAETISDAKNRIKGLHNLLVSLEADSVAEAQQNMQSLFSFVQELQEMFGVFSVDEVMQQINYLQSLHAYISAFDLKD